MNYINKIILALIIFVGAGIANANTSATMAVMSDYIWRGTSFSDNPFTTTGLSVENPAAVQGTLNHQLDFGLGGGLFYSNHFTGYQMNPYLYYYHTVGDTALRYRAIYFNFLKGAAGTNINALEVGITAWMAGFELEIDYMPEYFSAETNNIYVRVNYGIKLSDKLSLVPEVGYSSFGDEDKAGEKSYANVKIALQYKVDRYTAEFGYSDTNRTLISGTTETELEKTELTYTSLTIAL